MWSLEDVWDAHEMLDVLEHAEQSAREGGR